MTGQIKSGRGSLIGNAGEYYVVAELLRHGWVAALAPRNAPSFDVLATNGSKTVRIRVKTKSHEYDIWQWNAKDDGTIFRDLDPAHDFTVLVNLAPARHDLAFFVVPISQVNEWLVSRFEAWLRTPGKGGRPHAPSNRKRHIHFSEFREQLKSYEEHWELLWQ